MLAHMRTRRIDGGDELVFSLPRGKAGLTGEAIKKFLELLGHTVAVDDDLRRCTAHDVFPEATPAFALKGLRIKEGLTQAQLADRLSLKQHHISNMENGKRPISVKLAHHIEDVFGVTYKAFL